MSVDFAGLLDLQLGLTDLCNLSCVMCQQTAHREVYGAPGRTCPPMHGGRRGFMERALFERLLDSLVEDRFPVRVLSLMWIGESLLHPEFPSLLDRLFERAKEFPFAGHLVLNTNATLFTEEAEAVLLSRKADPASPPFTLVFSLDAASPGVFARLKGADLFDTACSNVERFLERSARLATPPDRPLTTVLQSLVLPENAHEAEAFRDRWSGLLRELDRPFDLCHDTLHGPSPVKIYFKRASSADQAALERLHRATAERLGLLHAFSERDGRVVEFDSEVAPCEPSRRRPCPAPFRTAAIDWDGTVVPCCVDTEIQLPLGNLADRGFRDIYLGPAAEALRLAHVEGDLAGRPVCRDCPNLHYPAVPDRDLVAWLVGRGLRDRARPFVERMRRAGKRRAVRTHAIVKPMDFRGDKKTIIVELSARCNLSCVMCEQSFDRTRRDKGLMDPALFRRIVDELVETEARANCVNVFWSGESLVHPGFVPMIEYAASRNADFRGFGALDLHTNGNLMDERVSRAIVDGGQFARVLVSLDAATGATYDAIRRGGDFARVVANAKRLVEVREEAGRTKPRLTLQFVVSARNRAEARAFLDVADGIFGGRGGYRVNHDWTLPAPFAGDVVFFKRLDEVETGAQVEAERIHREVALELGLLSPEAAGRAVVSHEFRADGDGVNPLTGGAAVRMPCVGLFTHLSVRWNGDVTACCRDIRCALKLGNLRDTTLARLWNSDTLTRMRLRHLEGRADEIPACRGCPNQICPVLEEAEALDYLRSVGRTDLIAPYLRRTSPAREGAGGARP